MAGVVLAQGGRMVLIYLSCLRADAMKHVFEVEGHENPLRAVETFAEALRMNARLRGH